MSRHEPMFNVPRCVLAIIAGFVFVHLLTSLLPESAESWVTLTLAFIPARYSGFALVIPGGDVAAVTAFVTYAFVHADLFHLAINAAWLVAFGSAIANRLGGARLLLFFAFCAAAGALAFLVGNPGLPVPMIGASGAVSGLMGGAMRFLFSAIDRGGLTMLRERPRDVPLLPMLQALTDRRVLAVTGVFLLANLLAVFGLGGVSVGGIAWEAHVGGYAAGLISIGFFEPRPTLHSPGSPISN